MKYFFTSVNLSFVVFKELIADNDSLTIFSTYCVLFLSFLIWLKVYSKGVSVGVFLESD